MESLRGADVKPAIIHLAGQAGLVVLVCHVGIPKTRLQHLHPPVPRRGTPFQKGGQ